MGGASAPELEPVDAPLPRHRPEGVLLLVLLAGAGDVAIAVFVGFALLRSEVWTFWLVALALAATGLMLVWLLRRARRLRQETFAQIAQAFEGRIEADTEEFRRELLAPLEPRAIEPGARVPALARFRVESLHCALLDLALPGGNKRTLLLAGPLAELGQIDTQVDPPSRHDAWAMRVAGDHALIEAGHEWIATDELPRFTGLALNWLRRGFGV